MTTYLRAKAIKERPPHWDIVDGMASLPGHEVAKKLREYARANGREVDRDFWEACMTIADLIDRAGSKH